MGNRSSDVWGYWHMMLFYWQVNCICIYNRDHKYSAILSQDALIIIPVKDKILILVYIYKWIIIKGFKSHTQAVSLLLTLGWF